MKPRAAANRLAACTALVLFCAAPVLAGEQESASIPANEPELTYDWGGAYGGLSYDILDGESSDSLGFQGDLQDDNAVSLFIGYRHQYDSGFVAAAELNYTPYDSGADGLAADIAYEDIIELRARLGYSLGRVLISGILGYGQQRYTNPGPGLDAELEGTTFGLGMEYALNERSVVGLDYLSRDLDGPNDNGSADVRFDDEALAFRFSLNF